MLDDDDTPPEHVFEQFEPEEGAWEEPAQDESARDAATAATALSRSPSMPVTAPVTSVVGARAAAGCDKRAECSVAIARNVCYNCCHR